MKVGDTIGPYHLLSRLGAGTFGVVWRAKHMDSNKVVAIKVIEPESPQQLSGLLNAFLKEVHTWASVTGHRNIHSLDSPEHHDGCLILVSACADGSLRDWILNQDGSPRKTLVPEAVEMCCGILSGLEHLHNYRNPILHRDLKPENVLLFNGVPKLADFGLSRIMEGSQYRSQIAGTLAYMAPENFNGEYREASDQWALGVILYEMVNGQLPFIQNNAAALMGAIIRRNPLSISEAVPSAVQAVIKRSLQKDHRKRFNSVTEMREALELAIRPSGTPGKYWVAAKQNDPVAQYYLGECYRDGDGVEQDYQEALRWYQLAAEQGNISAQNNLGACYHNGIGVTQDFHKATWWYQKAAEQGDATAQNNLGLCYANGYGVPQDYYNAVNWFQRAAEQDHTDAQYNLGVSYARGEGVEKNYIEAVHWYLKAAERGDAAAQNNLGLCYENGTGVPQDYREAVKWYLKAVKQGYAIAQRNLGVCYRNGNGVAKDHLEAIKWFRQAAEQGDAIAQNNLGWYYESGYGVKQDYKESVKWYRKAADQGNSDAQAVLKRLNNTNA